jgi:glycosyltransferase involved in cell wall biosynthesis
MTQVNAIVMPCLNEQRFLATSCASLGFGAGRTPPANSFLVIVDNGSTDLSLEAATEIQAKCAPGSVVLAQERARGYVPARWRGNRVAGETALARGIANEKVLILQADSDTQYSDD